MVAQSANNPKVPYQVKKYIATLLDKPQTTAGGVVWGTGKEKQYPRGCAQHWARKREVNPHQGRMGNRQN